MNEVPRLDAGASVDAVEAALREFGCAVIERLAPVEQLGPDRVGARATSPRDRAGRRRLHGSQHAPDRARCSRSPSFRDLAAHPLVLGALDRVLGDHATSYQLHLTQVIEIGPGEPAQLVHRDQWAFDFFPFPAGFEVECHTMWAMSDFTEENGATRVIPGSQQLGRQAPAHDRPDGPGRDAEGLGAALPRFALPRRRRQPVGAGPARINVGYTLSWLRQEENQYLACPPEVARELPEALARSRAINVARTRSATTATCVIRSRCCTASPTPRRASRRNRERAAPARPGRLRVDRAGARRRVAVPHRRRSRTGDRRRRSRPRRRRARRQILGRYRAHRHRLPRGDRQSRGRRGREHHADALPP